jgi:hypothetical protein
MMRTQSNLSQEAELDVYLVLDDFGERLGCAWRETDQADTGRANLLRGLLDGQFKNPRRIVAFNTAEGWSRDVTAELANDLLGRCADQGAVPTSLQGFLEEQCHAERQQLLLRF